MVTNEKPLEKIWMSFNSSTEKRHKDQLYIKAKIDNMQQNSLCRLCGNNDKDETINHMISKYRHIWVGLVIHWELCKKLKFDRSTGWYMHKPESIRENETHKIL